MWLINMITSISSLLLSCSFLMANAETYNHVQQLVYEKLDRFVQSPVTALELMADYYRMGGFPNDLGLVDREQTIKYLASLMNTLEDTGLKPFYGLEDGTLLGFWRSDVYDFVPSLVSREPGNSAYDPSDPNFEKYWNVFKCFGMLCGHCLKVFEMLSQIPRYNPKCFGKSLDACGMKQPKATSVRIAYDLPPQD